MMKHEYRALNNMTTETNSVTYIGHATTLIKTNGIHLITDPVFSDRINLGLVKRRQPLGVHFEKLPDIDAILISHDHLDHFDKSTLRRSQRDIPTITPYGLGNKISSLGFTDVRELSWWESTVVKGIIITAVPAAHWGISARASGFVIEGIKTIYFAGDTGLFDGMSDIGRKFDIYLALLPIGDYRPHIWFIPGGAKVMRNMHMAPNDIPEAIKMLRCKKVIPIHWGTFKISGTPLEEPPERMNSIIRKYHLNGTVVLLKHVETMSIDMPNIGPNTISGGFENRE